MLFPSLINASQLHHLYDKSLFAPINGNDVRQAGIHVRAQFLYVWTKLLRVRVEDQWGIHPTEGGTPGVVLLHSPAAAALRVVAEVEESGDECDVTLRTDRRPCSRCFWCCRSLTVDAMYLNNTWRSQQYSSHRKMLDAWIDFYVVFDFNTRLAPWSEVRFTVDWALSLTFLWSRQTGDLLRLQRRCRSRTVGWWSWLQTSCRGRNRHQRTGCPLIARPALWCDCACSWDSCSTLEKLNK